MRTALTAFISAASFCALAPVASAQTIPSNTGTPAYSYESQVPAQPAAVGSRDIIAGNRRSGQPALRPPVVGYAPVTGRSARSWLRRSMRQARLWRRRLGVGRGDGDASRLRRSSQAAA